MDNERARLLTRPLDSIPAIPARRDLAVGAAPPPPPPPGATRGNTDPHARLSRAHAAILALGWPVVVAVGVLIEPAPDGPGADATAPLAIEAASFLVFVAIVATIATAVRRRPSAALWSAGAGSVALAVAVSCPASGHHAYAPWWYAELAMVAGMLWVSAAARRRGRTVAVR